jgi:hypothetical protein
LFRRSYEKTTEETREAHDARDATEEDGAKNHAKD